MDTLYDLFFKVLGYGLFIAIILGLLGALIKGFKYIFNIED